MTDCDHVSNRRYLHIDVIKVAALCLMPICHFYEECVNFELLSDSFPSGTSLDIMGFFYCIVPTMFMFCMGVGMVCTKHNSEKDFLKRGLILIGVFFILNVFRFLIPLIISIPVYGSADYFNRFIDDFFLSDILCFAGLTFLVFALFKRLNVPSWMMLVIAVVMSMVQLAIPNIDLGSSVGERCVTDVIGWFVYTCPQSSYFPLIGWLIFPVVGYIYGQHLVRSDDEPRLNRNIFAVSALILVIMLLITVFITHDFTYIQWSYQKDFFMSPLSALFSLTLCSTIVSAMYLLTKDIGKGRFRDLFTSLSKEINGIYCIHWILLIWLIIYPLYLLDIIISSPFAIILGGLSLFVASAFLSPILRNFRNRYILKKNSRDTDKNSA